MIYDVSKACAFGRNEIERRTDCQRDVMSSVPDQGDFLYCTVTLHRNHKDRRVIDRLFDAYRPCSNATPLVHGSAVHHHFACSTANTAGLRRANAVIHQRGHSHCDPCSQHEAVQLPPKQPLLLPLPLCEALRWLPTGLRISPQPITT